ncbi:MAG: hypothetical protein P1V97_26830, partial [Planctomycetota bacterium]|nr:hypothetical protein [Planctomycetota bacterium]
ASTESVLKLAAEKTQILKELEEKKDAFKVLAKKPSQNTFTAKTNADGKQDAAFGQAAGRGDTAPERDLEDASEAGAVLMLSAANVEQARVDISLLVSQYSTLWENNGLNETWELELSLSEVEKLVSKLKGQSNIQLALVDRRSELLDFARLREDPDAQKAKDTIVDPAKDVEKMQGNKREPERKRKKGARPKKAAAKSPGAANPAPVSKAPNGVKREAGALQGVDTIVLRSGWNLSGTILEEGKDSLTMLSAGQKVNVKRRDIARLTRNSRRLNSPADKPTQVYRIRLVLTTPSEKSRMKRKIEKKK